MNRTTLLLATVFLSLGLGARPAYVRTALFPGFDGKWCKVQPSVATDGKGTALLTYQMLNLAGSDVFSGQYVSKSTDGGATWSAPEKIPESADVRERGLRVARYVNVSFQAVSGKWYATGSATMYDGDAHPFQKYVDGKPYCYPVQADVDARTGTVSNYRPMPFPFAYEHAMRYGQAVDCANGDVLMPFYFRAVGAGVKQQSVVVRYRPGPDGWQVVKAGQPLANPKLARGLGEPSLVKFRGRYYLTLRSDECGMFAESDDGLVFSKPVKWTWADGKPIGNANTQQHWVTADGRLHLAYTRVTPANGHVFRNRAPIYLAEFDPEKRCLLRETEMPIVPERGARLGNFAVAPGAAGESWLLTAEWMQPRGCERYGGDNSLWLVKVGGAKAPAARRGVLCLTFDDGHFDSWRKALPLLDKYGAKATFFVNGPIGPKQVAGVREFQSYGHSVGLHGQRHQKAAARLAQLGEAGYLAEEVEPQLAALRKAGLEVRCWAYPMSDRNEATDRALARHFTHLRAGHVFGRDPAVKPLATCDEAYAPRKGAGTRLVLPGVGFNSVSPLIVADVARGLERLAERDELLVLYSHDIRAVPDRDRHNTSLDVLEGILKKARELGVAVVGFDDLDALD